MDGDTLNQWKASKSPAPVAGLPVFLFILLMISDIVTKPPVSFFGNSSAPATFPYNSFIVTLLSSPKQLIGM